MYIYIYIYIYTHNIHIMCKVNIYSKVCVSLSIKP